jgi:hypothetical protein
MLYEVKEVVLMQLIALVGGASSDSYAAAVCLTELELAVGVSELVASRLRTLPSAIVGRSCSDFRKYSQVLEVN